MLQCSYICGIMAKIKFNKEATEFITGTYGVLDSGVVLTDLLSNSVYFNPCVFIQDMDDKKRGVFEVKSLCELPKEHMLEILRMLLYKK